MTWFNALVLYYFRIYDNNGAVGETNDFGGKRKCKVKPQPSREKQ